ncbi:hypothetical protein [Terrabacter sp. BE26]|uniref:hypothetical protein n=1 Tax=Terrabacter sp. BE26 TaxID=2898152 RepID=UPI0035BE143A
MTGLAAYVFDLDGVVRDFGPGDAARLFDAVLNSADFGVAKPDVRAYAAAHAAIEVDLRRGLGRGEIWFTDDRAENVAAASEFGWQAQLFTLDRQQAPQGA